MVIVGNTAMHHLALGLSPLGLTGAPFAPALDEPISLSAADLGVAMNPEGRVYFMPPIAGFVGSDCLAVIASTHLEAKRLPAMAIDIGTNTEIALVHQGKVSVTSCASGPAFEGYQIACGMKAAEGAIERADFTSDGHPRALQTIGGVEPVGICGSGVVDILAGLIASGVVDSSGLMQAHERVRRGAQGLEYVVTEGDHGEIVFTQRDVRALQLAKGAIATGWQLLLANAGLATDGPAPRLRRRCVRQLSRPRERAGDRPPATGGHEPHRLRGERRRRRRANGPGRRASAGTDRAAQAEDRVPGTGDGKPVPRGLPARDELHADR